MKSILDYISESKEYPTVKERVKELEELAKKKNLTVKFRDRQLAQGDFCIFIYHPDRRQYLVGFDGDWDSEHFGFEHCYDEALNWIETFDPKVFFRRQNK